MDHPIAEGLFDAVRREAELQHVLGADDTEIARFDRAGVVPHRLEQCPDPIVINVLVFEQGGERLAPPNPVSSSTSFCLALPDSPRNSLMNSRTVRL